ncbi:hypothetical protein Jiend_25670 [Micromonospora endophytica]|nr:hypothetical protein Jiend_25670 [Micromonospora endophytica]
MPPAATARTTAAEVQLAGVPVPIVRVGFAVSTARAAAGTATRPSGLPVRAPVGAAAGVGLALLGAPPRPLRADGLAVAGAGVGSSDGWSASATAVSASLTRGCWTLRWSARGTDGPPHPDNRMAVTPTAMTDLRRGTP